MRDEWMEHEVEALMTKFSTANRASVSRYLSLKRAQGVKPGSLRNYAYWLAKVDAHVRGKEFPQLEPSDLSSFFEGLHRSQPPGRHPRATQALGFLRPYLKWILDSDPLPPKWAAAIKQRWRYEIPKVSVVTGAEIDRMVSACAQVRDKAIILTLADTGFRNSELCALNVGSVNFDGNAGATLTLPQDGAFLKTGPRTIYVVRCGRILRAWLQLHPQARRPDAPLFFGLRRANQMNRLDRAAVSVLFRHACKVAGLRRIHPHLLRHTRATETARTGWNEAQQRSYFGWGRTSRMPSHYTHLAASDMRIQILRDAGLGDTISFTGPQSKPHRHERAIANEGALGQALSAIAESQKAIVELLRSRQVEPS